MAPEGAWRAAVEEGCGRDRSMNLTLGRLHGRGDPSLKLNLDIAELMPSSMRDWICLCTPTLEEGLDTARRAGRNEKNTEFRVVFAKCLLRQRERVMTAISKYVCHTIFFDIDSPMLD